MGGDTHNYLKGGLGFPPFSHQAPPSLLPTWPVALAPQGVLRHLSPETTRPCPHRTSRGAAGGSAPSGKIAGASVKQRFLLYQGYFHEPTL